MKNTVYRMVKLVLFSALFLPLAAVPGSCFASGTDGYTLQPFLEIDGLEVNPDSVSVESSQDKMKIKLSVPRDGTYRFGVSVISDEIKALQEGFPVYSDKLLGSTVIRYPYDWTFQGNQNVLTKPRLVMPGIIVSDQVMVVDTKEFFSIRFEQINSRKSQALFLKHYFYNDCNDEAKTEQFLKKGEQVEFSILRFKNLDEAKASIWGTASPMKGVFGKIYYRNWPVEPFGRPRYEFCAKKLKGVFDYIVLREPSTEFWMPKVFQEQGIKAYSYHFLGALHQASPQITPEVKNQYGLTDCAGHYYTAPKTPNGNWVLLNIRNPDVRHLLVKNISRDIENGFDGIFLDGYAIWPDSMGLRGGNVPDASISMVCARWLLLKEIKEAMALINPNSKLFILGSHYYDILGVADGVVKERMYWNWDEYTSDYFDRKTTVIQDHPVDVEAETLIQPFVAKNLCYGFKGYSPLSVQSAKSFARYLTGLSWISMGDFFIDQYEQWAVDYVDTVICTQHINNIAPAHVSIHFKGKSTIYAEEDCEVEFNKPVSVYQDGEELEHEVTSLLMSAGAVYQIR